jgi:hypothetical protein
VIVPTDVAVAFLMREGVTEEAARKWIYRASADDVLINWGKSGNGNARWDLAEIEALMWPKSPLPGRELSE